MQPEMYRSRRRNLALNLAVLGVIGLARSALAVTTLTDTFTGGGSPANQWLVPGNRSLGVVPNDTTDPAYLVNISTPAKVGLAAVPPGFPATSVAVFDLNMASATTFNVHLPLSVTDALSAAGATINVVGSTFSLAPQNSAAVQPPSIAVTSGGLA